MRPVVTVAEMRAVDRDALAATTHEELVGRAGRRLAAHAKAMLGPNSNGRRVVIVAGKGSNGADGRVAARWLRSWGSAVLVLDAAEAPERLPEADLVVDAAYGTGFAGAYHPPDPGGATVLACDLPTGLDADTGAVAEGVEAEVTVTFGAVKPGLLLGDGPGHTGRVHVEPIGLDCSRAQAWLVEDGDVALVPSRPREAHKWQSAVLVVAGSPGMLGAAQLCATSAMRSGAGYVLLASPGCAAADLPVGAHVGRSFPVHGWEADAVALLKRVHAVAMGPGLGISPATSEGVRAVLGAYGGPVVLDADALAGLDLDLLARRRAATVLTPHEGEFTRLFGLIGQDRIGAVVGAAARSGAVVLLKGPTTVIADPSGAVRLAAAGTPSLASAGTGDVLTGLVAALLACGVPALDAAGLAAHAHGAAARLGPAWGLLADDLPALVSRWLSTDHTASGPTQRRAAAAERREAE